MDVLWIMPKAQIWVYRVVLVVITAAAALAMAAGIQIMLQPGPSVGRCTSALVDVELRYLRTGAPADQPKPAACAGLTDDQYATAAAHAAAQVAVIVSRRG